jgi:phosphate transport system substrate-binding protein
MNRVRRRIAASLAVVSLLGIAAPAAALATNVLSLSGATASFPLVSLLAQRYVKLYPHKVKFKIAQGGAQIGVNDVAAGRVSIGDVSRDPQSNDPTGLVFYPVAKYYICAVTNKANTLANLTQPQLQAIFTGKTRSWTQVPGATATGTIDVVSRTSVAGVLTNFQTLLLGGKTVSSIAAQEPSEGLLQQQVENDPNAIGFLSGYLADKGVNPVGFAGVGCNLANAISGQYAGVAHFYEVTKGRATGAAASFIGWIEHSKVARKIISTQWIPVN